MNVIRKAKNYFGTKLYEYVAYHSIPHEERKNGNDFGIVTVLCHRDLSLFIICVNSLFQNLHTAYPICIFDDGSLTQEDVVTLETLLSAVVILHSQAEKQMRSLLKNYPCFSQYRFSPKTAVYKYKFDAILLNPFSKFLYLDSDILFLSFPKEIQAWIRSKRNYIICTDFTEEFKEHCRSRSFPNLCFRELFLQMLSIKQDPFFISSMIGLSKEHVFSFRFLEEVFRKLMKVDFINNDSVDENILNIALSGYRIMKLNPKMYFNFVSEFNDKDEMRQAIMVHLPGESKSMLVSMTLRYYFSKMFRFRTIHVYRYNNSN